LAAVVTDAGGVNAQPDVWGPHLPLAVLVGGGGPFTLAPARRAAAPPRPGDWMVAVWRSAGGPAFAAGNFRQTVSDTCGLTNVQELSSSLSFNRNMLGGGVFDLDGGLLAMILPCRSGFSAVAVESIAAMLDHEATIQQRLLGRYGLGIGTLNADEQRHFDTTTGLVVREVWTGSAADGSGFLPGDLVITVAGKSVTTANDLEPLLTQGQAPFPVTVKRGQRTVALALSATANSSETVADSLDVGLVLQSVSGSIQIVDVRRGSRAAAAGIAQGDRLVRVDRAEPRSLRDAQRVLGRRGRSPSLLEVEREGRRLAILLPPPPAP
jgi:S1-C subfamily serine protease